jgi:preprotein translocase subunit YajC
MQGFDASYLILFGGMLLIMWLFMIRPQAKQAKQAADFQKSLEKGTKVVTAGGIHGKIVRTDDGTAVWIEIDNNCKMKIERSAVSMELTKAAYGEEEKKA